MEALETIQIENYIIGQIGLEAPAFFVVADFLTASSFQYKPNQKVFRSCCTLTEQAQPVNLVTLRPYLSNQEFDRLVYLTCKVHSCTHLAWHCVKLIEYNIRSYILLQSEKVAKEIPANVLADFRQFQENICLVHGYNDLGKLLTAGSKYFKLYAPKLTVRIENTLHLWDKKAAYIREQHGKKMILETLQYYEDANRLS